MSQPHFPVPFTWTDKTLNMTRHCILPHFWYNSKLLCLNRYLSLLRNFSYEETYWYCSYNPYARNKRHKILFCPKNPAIVTVLTVSHCQQEGDMAQQTRVHIGKPLIESWLMTNILVIKTLCKYMIKYICIMLCLHVHMCCLHGLT